MIYQQRSDTCNKLCSLPGGRASKLQNCMQFLKSILLKTMNATRSCTWLMKFALFQDAQTRVSSLIQTTCDEKVCRLSCSDERTQAHTSQHWKVQQYQWVPVNCFNQLITHARSQDLGFRTSKALHPTVVLSFSLHFSLRPVVTDGRSEFIYKIETASSSSSIGKLIGAT